jgi:hypothetical protein
MARLCSRPGCSAPAAATFNFDGLNRIVWLNDVAHSPIYTAGDLCARHAERLQPPRNWELRDARPTRVTCPAAAAPSRQLPPARPRRPAAPARAPRRARQPVAGFTAGASTPLLARAFRGVDGA